MSTSIDIPSLLTIVYVMVDDWYEREGKKLLKGKPGVKPIFRDSEVLTLALVQDYIPYPSEQQFVEFMRANYGDLFPELLDQSQFNRRLRGLRSLLEALRRNWLHQLNIHLERQFLLDTKPVPVMGYKRSKKHSDFAGHAAYGYCASQDLKYFGYKLVTLTTLAGLPAVYELVPANWDERAAAETLVFELSDSDIFADKGFIGDEWQLQILEQTGNHIWTVKRRNQKHQNPSDFDRLLNRVRRRIESTFNEIQNTGRHLSHLLAKTIGGLFTRLAAKMTSHLLKFLLRRDFGIDVQTFSIVRSL
jgi:hypothetical protein